MRCKKLFVSLSVMLGLHSVLLFGIFHHRFADLPSSQPLSNDVSLTRDTSHDLLDEYWEDEMVYDLLSESETEGVMSENVDVSQIPVDRDGGESFHDDRRNSENHTKETDRKLDAETKFTKMILILTESRHGSTWLMDILSYPDTSVPVFEPLNIAKFLKMYARSEAVRNESLESGCDPVTYADWRSVFLGRLCLCDFRNQIITDEQLSGRKYGGIIGLGYKSKRLGTDFKFEHSRSIEICPHNDTFIVPKTIRLYNITELYRLPEFGCNNFKVIHLVRDPRAVMTSRIDVFRELYDGNKLLGEQMPSSDQENFPEVYMRRAARDLCSHHLHNYQVGHVTTPTWLRDRYKLVRYEDLATQPDKWAEELFAYAGIPYTDKYREYVYNTTHIRERGMRDRGSYSVEREAREIVNSWRTELHEDHWRTIEQECGEMMTVMGYNKTFS